jgi:hypothetical protein
MSCTLSAGNQLGCRNSIAGVKTIYLSNFSDNESYSVDANNQITGITSGATYYIFEQRPQAAELNETINASIENGTLFYTAELTLSFDKNEVALRNQIALMAQAQLRVIALDQNGTYQLLGKVNGADITAGSLPRGKAYGDKNGATLTITAYEPQPANYISAAAFATITTAQ